MARKAKLFQGFKVRPKPAEVEARPKPVVKAKITK